MARVGVESPPAGRAPARTLAVADSAHVERSRRLAARRYRSGRGGL